MGNIGINSNQRMPVSKPSIVRLKMNRGVDNGAGTMPSVQFGKTPGDCTLAVKSFSAYNLSKPAPNGTQPPATLAANLPKFGGLNAAGGGQLGNKAVFNLYEMVSLMITLSNSLTRTFREQMAARVVGEISKLHDEARTLTNAAYTARTMGITSAAVGGAMAFASLGGTVATGVASKNAKATTGIDTASKALDKANDKLKPLREFSKAQSDLNSRSSKSLDDTLSKTFNGEEILSKSDDPAAEVTTQLEQKTRDIRTFEDNKQTIAKLKGKLKADEELKAQKPAAPKEKIEVKEEPKKVENQEIKEEPKKDEIKPEEIKKEESQEIKDEIKKDENQEIKKEENQEIGEKKELDDLDKSEKNEDNNINNINNINNENNKDNNINNINNEQKDLEKSAVEPKSEIKNEGEIKNEIKSESEIKNNEGSGDDKFEEFKEDPDPDGVNKEGGDLKVKEKKPKVKEKKSKKEVKGAGKNQRELTKEEIDEINDNIKMLDRQNKELDAKHGIIGKYCKEGEDGNLIGSPSAAYKEELHARFNGSYEGQNGGEQQIRLDDDAPKSFESNLEGNKGLKNHPIDRLLVKRAGARWLKRQDAILDGGITRAEVKARGAKSDIVGLQELFKQKVEGSRAFIFTQMVSGLGQGLAPMLQLLTGGAGVNEFANARTKDLQAGERADSYNASEMQTMKDSLKGIVDGANQVISTAVSSYAQFQNTVNSNFRI